MIIEIVLFHLQCMNQFILLRFDLQWNYVLGKTNCIGVGCFKLSQCCEIIEIVVASIWSDVSVLDLIDLVGPIDGPAFSSQTLLWWSLEYNHNLP